MSPAAAVIACSLLLSSEQLIVFVQDADDNVSRVFEAEQLDPIRQLATELGVEVMLVDASGGAPAGVAITPTIAYMNHAGRSIYQGRYTTLDRLKNFVQTSRVVPQGPEPLIMEDRLVSRIGREVVVTPIKISDVSGTLPDGHGRAEFVEAMRRSIDAGMRGFSMEPRVEMSRTARRFYVDFHPYRSAAGELFVSTSLFSQFHCHEPLYVSSTPTTGRWEDRDAVFARAAADLDKQIDKAIANATIGDGFTPLASSVPIVTWEQLGLALPPRPTSGGVTAAVGVELPVQWTVDSEAHAGQAPVLFRFPAPLDAYSGQATKLSGSITTGKGGALAGTRGRLDVRTDSVTMGEEDLDAYIHGAGMLEADPHPVSSFEFDEITPERPSLEFATIVPATLSGRFTMKGVEIPLTVPVQLEAIIGDDGRPRLVLDGSWQINIREQFGIAGPPDGPVEAQNTMLFTCRIMLKGV